jgi:hypothetical protein
MITHTIVATMITHTIVMSREATSRLRTCDGDHAASRRLPHAAICMPRSPLVGSPLVADNIINPNASTKLVLL